MFRLLHGVPSLAALLAVLASPLLHFPEALAEAPSAIQEATDTVFLVDSSGSNFRSDPQGARRLLIEAFASFAAYRSRQRPGDRIAVAQFAGWEETSRNGRDNVVLPLTEVPKAEEERSKLMDELRTGLEKMKPFGVGTDPNAALEIVLPLVVGPSGTEPRVPAPETVPPARALWAVIITDGDINVVEGATARDIYIERAEKKHGTATPETLSVVASEMFFTETLPRLTEKYEKNGQGGVTVTPVGLGLLSDDRAGKPPTFFDRVKEAVGAEVLRVDGPLLGRTFTSLLKRHPQYTPSETASYAYARAVVEAGAEQRIPFRLLPETRRTRAVFFGSSGDYKVAVSGAGDPELPVGEVKAAALPKDLTWGKGHFRVLEFASGAAGDYEFVVENISERALEVEVTLYPDVALAVALEGAPGGVPVDDDGALTSPAGRPLVCTVSVLGLRKPEEKPEGVPGGEVVVTGAALTELDVTLEVTKELEATDVLPVEPVSHSVTFADLPEARARAELAPVADWGLWHSGWTGKLTARLRAFPVRDEEGELISYIYEAPLKVLDLKLIPAIEVRFGFASAFAGQVVPLEGTFTVPSHMYRTGVPPEEVLTPDSPDEARRLTVRFSPPRRHGEPARLVRRAGENGYEGSVKFPESGEWRIARSDTADLLVIPGEPFTMTVRERRMRVLRPGAPADAGPDWEIKSLEFNVRFCEKAGPSENGRGETLPAYELPVLIDLDVGPDEVPEFPPASFKPSEALAEPGILARVIPLREAAGPDSLKVEIKPVGEPKPGSSRVEAKVFLTVATNGVLPKDPGTAQLQAKVGETGLTKDVEITLAFSDFWQKLIMLTWMYWGPVLLVILLILWWALLARFNRQLLYVVTRFEAQAAGFHPLRDLCEGSRRQAFGTPEVENVAQFRIKGTKLGGGRVSVRGLREGVAVAVGGVGVSDWNRLHHGDEVIAENPEGAYCRYWYFDRPPTEEELQAMLAADAIELGPDEFVIEGL